MTAALRVGVVGLGLMGMAMAERLVAAGHEVHGYTRSRDGRATLATRGGIAHGSTAAVTGACEVVVLSLPDGAASREVAAEVATAATGGTVVVDTTTVAPADAEAVAEGLARAGARCYDVGLSGSSAAVRRRGVLALAGGPADGFDPVRAVLEAFCSRVVMVGGAGDGMRAKLVVNHVHALNRLALAEGLVLAERMGMDLDVVLDVLQSSAASSKAGDTWGPRMVAGDHDQPQSRVRTGLKDARLIAAEGRRHGAPTPGLAQYVRLMEEAVAAGLGDADNSALVEMLRRAVSPPPAEEDPAGRAITPAAGRSTAAARTPRGP